MTDDRDFKQHVRARKAATGVPYTQARAELMAGDRIARHLADRHDVVADPSEMASLLARLDQGAENGWLVEVHGARVSDGERAEVVVTAEELRAVLL